MFLLKLCLILAAVAGVSSAVTVPVVLHLQGKAARVDSSRGGGNQLSWMS
ncbi:hypothetical protein MHM_04400 [Candidatus Mycoplasma haemominutum 'Birmingham 1']|uniref:Uncharacterized protein n=1 Tax=Candidatus Mycoplasma haematominutum 'Birmingham 1' TaxID=1116213 RepID=G8C3R0_9MOLU|nr:hypothetical protein MHM_04400 [Candidatus Mycoplasma haematominutum 'Birmingham 1']